MRELSQVGGLEEDESSWIPGFRGYDKLDNGVPTSSGSAAIQFHSHKGIDRAGGAIEIRIRRGLTNHIVPIVAYLRFIIQYS